MDIVNWNKTSLYSLVRYILGLTMTAYGLSKILQVQFKLPSEIYTYELNQLDGVTLTWAFLGFSQWFSIFLGIFEFIPGVLLLFRKTKLLGAILLLPFSLVVFLVNNAYDFLPHMKVFTGIILLLNLFLLLPGYKLFINFINKTIDQSSFSLIELIFNIVLIGIVVVLMISNFWPS